MYPFIRKRRGALHHLKVEPAVLSNGPLPPAWLDYEKVGWNALAFVAPLPRNESVIWVSDANIIKQIVNDRVLFPKPLERYRTIEVYGKVRSLAFRLKRV